MSKIEVKYLLPLLIEGGLGLGGGVDLPKECFFGEDLFSAKLTEGRDTGCLAAATSFLRGVLVGAFFLKIFSELPVNFSRLELVELVESSIFLVFNGAAILLAPAVVLDGFLVLASSVDEVVVVVGVMERTKLS